MFWFSAALQAGGGKCGGKFWGRHGNKRASNDRNNMILH